MKGDDRLSFWKPLFGIQKMDAGESQKPFSNLTMSQLQHEIWGVSYNVNPGLINP